MDAYAGVGTCPGHYGSYVQWQRKIMYILPLATVCSHAITKTYTSHSTGCILQGLIKGE